MTKAFRVDGWIRQDGFGRVVIDRCCSDEAHLQSAPTGPEGERPTCRHLLEEFFTRGKLGDEMVGRKGTLRVLVEFEPDRDAGEISAAVKKYLEERAS